jgi:uncharacterized membrane protein
MNAVELIGPAIAVAASLLILWWGVACRAGRFRRNPILGYRTAAALRSPEAWNAAHRGYAPWVIAAGSILAIAGVVAIIGVLADVSGLVGPVLGVGIALLLVALIAGVVPAHRSLAAYLRENGTRNDD